MILDWFISITGPVFIWWFIFLSALVIFGIILLNKFDKTSSLPLPSLGKLDPYEIAYLSENWQGVVRLAIFNLLRKKAIKIEQKKFWIFKIKSDKVIKLNSKKFNLNSIEEEVYSFVGNGRDALSFFKTTLKNHLSKYLHKIESKLKSQNLIKKRMDDKAIDIIKKIAIVTLFLVGGLKLFFGLIREKPVTYLIILLIIDFIFILLFFKSKDKKTELGRRYLKNLEKTFEPTKNLVKSGIKDENDPSLAIAVAIFGTSILAGYTLFDAYRTSYFKTQNWNGGGCGGGGGGCGGGGCGGGGCGGCGG
jgi:uncharacterized protein (TIGR04222 family)